ncbi:MAG: GDSL-type esterase/lipase family protein [Sandaracinaceae bacterium]
MSDDLLGKREEGTLVDAFSDSPSHRDPARVANEERTTARGLVHLLVAVGVASALAVVPYASADFAPWQVWVRGEGVPIVRMFTESAERAGGIEIATGGAVTRGGGGGTTGIPDQIATSLLADETPDVAPPTPSEDDPSGPRVRIDPSELEGLVRELEDPDGRAMRPFYEALVRTAEREDHAITRVAHYGDSSIAGDGITVTLRRRLQQRFGDAGHGFVLIARGTMPYRHQDIRHSANGPWNLSQLIRAGLRSHRYGYGGVLFRAGPGPTARFETSERGPVGNEVSRFELWYEQHPTGGRVQLRVDEEDPVEVNTRGEPLADGWHAVDVADGAHRLDLRVLGGGDTRLYGMVLEREGPGVVYDSLGLVGARARRMLGIDPAHFRSQHAHRGTNLIVLAFGGNDADDRRTADQFEDDFRQVARMVRRARPEASCLLMAPLDQAERDERGNVRTMETVPVIVDAMRRAATAEGCAFFDTYTAMGGEGAMREWSRANPRLAFTDYRHATPAGYRVVGNMLYKALLKGFADYLARTGQ